MRNRNLTLFGPMLVLVMAVPLYAYRLALKDGQTILFEKCRVTEKTLFYAGADGKEIAIPLQDVDLERTQKLNAGEPVALNLPGLVPSSGSKDGTDPSVADVARQQRKKTSGSGAEHVFTNDDMVHSSVAVPITQTAPADNNQVPVERIQKIVDRFSNKSAAQLANELVGDVQFSGRDVWERQLYAEGQRVLKFAKAYLERMKKVESITDYSVRKTNIETADDLAWQVNFEETAYAQLSADGSRKANEWQKRPQ